MAAAASAIDHGFRSIGAAERRRTARPINNANALRRFTARIQILVSIKTGGDNLSKVMVDFQDQQRRTTLAPLHCYTGM